MIIINMFLVLVLSQDLNLEDTLKRITMFSLLCSMSFLVRFVLKVAPRVVASCGIGAIPATGENSILTTTQQKLGHYMAAISKRIEYKMLYR